MQYGRPVCAAMSLLPVEISMVESVRFAIGKKHLQFFFLIKRVANFFLPPSAIRVRKNRSTIRGLRSDYQRTGSSVVVYIGEMSTQL